MDDTPERRGPGVKGAVGRLIGLGLVATVAAQVAGVAFALRRRGEVGHSPEAPNASQDEVDLTAIFGPLDFTSTAASFRGGRLACLYGGGLLDLRGATLAPDGATLKVQAFSGGAQILVPSEWRVTSQVLGLGGVGDARPSIDRPADAPVLRIEGWAMFGGFGIASEAPQDHDPRSAVPIPTATA